VVERYQGEKMGHPAIDLIENGSYSKAAELMLIDVYQDRHTRKQIDYWTGEIKRKHEDIKKTVTDFGIMPVTLAEKVYLESRQRMTPETEQYRNLSGQSREDRL
jgi:hypothetical protein